MKISLGNMEDFMLHIKMLHGIKNSKKESEKLAKKLGFKKVSKQKLAVVKKIKEYIISGGFVCNVFC